ncbi:MAG TPA: twin-arginine translocation signal domain-containing protein, partial [Rhodocyclaceae bacterium]|nr:twin-arginine translocation signal domain-containing protein [Rhodocyclaceae bacterium]
MNRRAFVKTCTVGAGLLAGGSGRVFPSGASTRHYHRVRLLDDRGQPLRMEEIHEGVQYVFPYPYAATPCFLLNLGRPVPGQNGLTTESGERYDWPGGSGPARSVVAYSAICAHKMAHPARGISYISFREPRNGEDPVTGVISCCAENSRYDPFSGGTVLSGPAPQPLAAILLDHDTAHDELHAVGTLGGEMFQRFFTEFEARLSIEYPNRDVRI